ncbi:MAG: hypothetical protein M3R27_12315 [Bacteroidota bacterium]|nr:hypothetical protein [Bacteroidota bacterium]
MKKLLLLFCFSLFGFHSFGQEFANNNNGFIYADTTIRQLKFIVDSLNLKFKVCDLNKQYYSMLQGKAHYVILNKKNVKAAVKDMEAGISFEGLKSKYKGLITDKDLIVYKYEYTDYENTERVSFYSPELGGGHDHELEFDKQRLRSAPYLKGSWLIDYSSKSEYSAESVQAFYLTENMSAPALPEKYARLVQYSDCLVDTNASVFYENAKRTGRHYDSKTPAAVSKFMEQIHKLTGKPVYSEDTTYWDQYAAWDSLKFSRADSLFKNDPSVKWLFEEAVKSGLADGGSTDEEFEEYVGKYDSKKNALEFKRRRVVVGGCSMDQSPRYHAQQIARLSAETVNWEIFLRSHLDIMNDRFERVSDGSWAWAGRKTYIAELEALEINVPDLLFGICLRVSNPSQNHYFGDIGRLGRALSESKDKVLIEKRMLEMIADKSLDDFNRVLVYYLFSNYNYNLPEGDEKKENTKRLNEAIAELPPYLSEKINSKK